MQEENVFDISPYYIPDLRKRLNSNIYKNIFGFDVMDYTMIASKLQNQITSLNEIKQENHGFSAGDVLYKDSNGNYGKALANADRSNVVGIVTKVASSDIFTLMSTGVMEYEYLPYKDTTILYLSDRLEGKLAHYLDIYNKVYVPVAIYINKKIILNIQSGISGVYLQPYSDEARFEPYSKEDIDDIIETVWDNA